MKTKKFPIEWYPNSHLNEIYQAVTLKFAFLSPPRHGSKQCHVFAKCRDFLHDAVRCAIQKTDMSLYSFVFKHDKNPPIDLRAIRMLVCKDNCSSAKAQKEWDEKMDAALKLLNHYEGLAGSVKSKVVRIADKKGHWLFTGPSWWMKSPYLISMYTFLIRLGDRKIEFADDEELKVKLKAISIGKKDKNDNDVGYLLSTWDKMSIVIKNRAKLFGPKLDPIFTKADITIDSFHNYCGIVSLCQSNTLVPEVNAKLKKLYKAEGK